MVKANVKTCPPENGNPPLSVEVEFEVFPPIENTPEAGGHAHDGPRPTGSFNVPPPAPPAQAERKATCTVDNFDMNGEGSCTVTFHSSEVGGVERIQAEVKDLEDFPLVQQLIAIEVPGLENLRNIDTNLFHFTGATTIHPDNLWGTTGAVRNIQLMALDYLELSCDRGQCATLRINDMSLPKGGLFAICDAWAPQLCIPKGHFEHRSGWDVDIGTTACRGLIPEGSEPVDCPLSERVDVEKHTLASICKLRDGTMAQEANHHCGWD